jgi:hypothetical protein
MERTPEQDEAFKLHYNLKTLQDSVTEYTTLLNESENIKRRIADDEKKNVANPVWANKLKEVTTKMETAMSLAVQAKKDLKSLICTTIQETSCCASKPKTTKKAKTV